VSGLFTGQGGQRDTSSRTTSVAHRWPRDAAGPVRPAPSVPPQRTQTGSLSRHVEQRGITERQYSIDGSASRAARTAVPPSAVDLPRGFPYFLVAVIGTRPVRHGGIAVMSQAGTQYLTRP